MLCLIDINLLKSWANVLLHACGTQSLFGLQELDFNMSQKCSIMCSSPSVKCVYWVEELFFALAEWLFWSLFCRECWLSFTRPPGWLCLGSAPPGGASGRSAGSACRGADCTEVAVHRRPVPPAPHTEGRVALEGRVGVYLSRSSAPEDWLQAPAKQAAV